LSCYNFLLLSICGLLKADPRKILSFKSVRSTKKVADSWCSYQY